MSVKFSFTAPVHLLGGSKADSLSLGGSLNMGANIITNIGTSSSTTSAASVGFVNTAIAAAGFGSVIDSAVIQVRLSTTSASPLPAFTVNSGNTTLTATANGALSLDATAANVGDYVLVKDNATSAVNNGPYQVTATGSSGAPWLLTRMTGFALTNGLVVVVSQGTTLGLTMWLMTSPTTSTIGTNSLVFGALSSGGGSSTLSLLQTTSTTYSDANNGATISLAAPAVDFIGVANWGMVLPAGLNNQIINFHNCSSTLGPTVTVSLAGGVSMVDADGTSLTYMSLQRGQGVSLVYKTAASSWFLLTGGAVLG